LAFGLWHLKFLKEKLLLGFFVGRVLAAPATKLFQF
jgi:hypothetical protein